MKKTIILLILFTFNNCIKAQCGIDCLYDSLQYTNGICEKTIVVTYLSVGKNPISPGNDKDDDIRKIKDQIGYIPHSSVSFLYNGIKYYISISDECCMSKYSKGDKIKIDISFYKDMKQPYKYINPFSIITSVNEYESKNHGENHGDR